MLSYLQKRSMVIKTESTDHYYWRLRMLADFGPEILASFDKLVANKNSYLYVPHPSSDQLLHTSPKVLRTGAAKQIYEARLLGCKLQQLYSVKEGNLYLFHGLKKDDFTMLEKWKMVKTAPEKLEILHQVKKSYYKIMLHLVSSNLDPDGLIDILRTSVRLSYHYLVVDLVAFGKDVDQKDSDGVTCLMRAGSSGNIGSFKLLLELGANPEAKTNDGQSVTKFIKKALLESATGKKMVAILENAILKKQSVWNGALESTNKHLLETAMEGLSIAEDKSPSCATTHSNRN